MPQETNLNILPYFDDYDPEKNYHRILFRPSFPIQARELTQLQSILQNQIERFGQNIYKTGTVISGCAVTTDEKYNFVKLKDVDVDNFDVNVASLANCFVYDLTTQLKAVVVNTLDGLESNANGVMKTMYVKYIKAGSNTDQSSFTPGTSVFVQKQIASVEEFRINAGGSGYTNSMYIYAVQSPLPTTNAYGRLVTDSAGIITDITIVNAGEGYTNDPASLTVEYKYANGATPVVGVGANVSPINYVSRPVVSNTGIGYGLHVSDGIIFQKGFFTRVDAQEIVVSNYESVSAGQPNNVSVGFTTEEAVVNGTVDGTLLDNAAGFTNYEAPGAHRLKLTPTLTLMTKEQLSDVVDGVPSVENFFTLVEFQNGNIVRDKTSTQFNAVDTELAKRTYEESGNYVVRPISIATEDAAEVYGNSSYADTINVIVGRGVAYVQGHRNELVNNLRLPISKANTTVSHPDQMVSTTFENYFQIPQEKWFGVANVQYGELVNLYSGTLAIGQGQEIVPGAAIPANSGIASNTIIGTARVRSLTYNGSGGSVSTNLYNLYVFDIKLNSGKSASDIQTIGLGGKFAGSVSATSSGIVLNGSLRESLVFRLEIPAVSSINNSSFEYRRHFFSTVASNTFAVNTASGSATFLYNGTNLVLSQREDFVVVANGNIISANIAGSANLTSNSTATVVSLNGNSAIALFKPYENSGMHVRITDGSVANTFYYPILSVANATHFTLPSYANTANLNSANIAYCFPNNAIISPAMFSLSIVNSNTATFTLNAGSASWSGATGGVTVYGTVKKQPGAATKTSNTFYVKIDSVLANTYPTGPWCLGVPDAYRIDGVWIGSGSTYADEAVVPNVKSSFELSNGQKESFYGLSYLKLRSGAALSLSGGKNLLVKVSAYTVTAAGDYATVQSYASANLENIPVFTTKAQSTISLRDAIDFRPAVSNTVVYSQNAASATAVNATSYASTFTVETIPAAERTYPSPVGIFQGDITSYVPRRDKIVVSKSGAVTIVTGTPSISPISPLTPADVLVLGEMFIPPYPSLSYDRALESGRLDYGITVTAKQQTRYTMADIQNIENRVDKLEYYSSLNTLESQTQSLTILSESNTSFERFKNGFLVDPMKNYSFANANFDTFEIDKTNTIATPKYKRTALKLKVANTANVDIYTNTLNKTQHALLKWANNQSSARFDKPTKQRNLVENFIRYNGRMFVTPPIDVTNTVGAGGVDYYIRQQSIFLNISGLMPNKKHYVFFDGVNVTQWCRPASITNTGMFGYSTFGSALTSSASDGRLGIEFAIPASTFVSGEKDIVVMDVATLNSVDAATSIVAGIFRGFSSSYLFVSPPIITIPSPSSVPVGGTDGGGGYQLGPAGLVFANGWVLPGSSGTDQAAGITTNGQSAPSLPNAQNIPEYPLPPSNVTGNEFLPDVASGGSSSRGFGVHSQVKSLCVDDPLAQTFWIPKDPDAGGKLISGIKLLFARKSDSSAASITPYSGVTVELRKTINGYPSGPEDVIARTYLISDSINVLSSSATTLDTSKYTTFTFGEPVFVQNDTEYAIVVRPDGNIPDYLAWVGKIGENVFATSIQYTTQDSVTPGMLFQSTNAKSWSPLQGEDLVYDIQTIKFAATAGSFSLVPNDYEFLTFDVFKDKPFTFIHGQKVAQLQTTYGAGQLAANGAMLNGPTFTTQRLYGTNPVSNASYQIFAASGSPNLTGFANGEGIVILRVEPTMAVVVHQVAANNRISISANGTTVLATNTTVTTPTLDAYMKVGDFVIIPSEANNSNSFSNSVIRQVVSVTSPNTFVIDAPVSASALANVGLFVANNIKTFITTVSSAGGNNTVINLTDFVPTEFVANSSGNTGMSNVAYSYQKAPIGTVDTVDTLKNKLYVEGSSANIASFITFEAANSTYLGTLLSTYYTNTTSFSTAYANTVSVDDVVIDNFSTYANYVVPSGTTIASALATAYDSTTANPRSKDFNLNAITNIGYDTVVRSKSNQSNDTNYSVTLNINLSSLTDDCSPKICVSPAGLVIHTAQINNDLTNEHSANNDGAATAKYVSTTATLASSLDAEDIFCYLTAYRPANTDLKVYARVLSRTDARRLDDTEWSELVCDMNENLYSSTANLADFREYRYTFRKKPETTVLLGAGYYVNGQTNVYANGAGSSWSSNSTANVASGDIVVISDPAFPTIYDVGVVSTANDTQITLASPLTVYAAPSSVVVEKVLYPKQAFKHYGNDNIVRYYDAQNAAHDTYQQYAIKVVMTRDATGVVPMINDARTIATSV